MENIKITLREVLTLEADICGVVEPTTQKLVRKGLLHYPLPMDTKYWLVKLSKSLKKEKTIIEEFRNELIKKYGTEQPENKGVMVTFTINELDKKGKPVYIKDKEGKPTDKIKQIINPQYVEFDKDLNTILDQIKEVSYRKFTLEEFKDIQSEETYDAFFKLIENSELKEEVTETV